jgi:hypothetical protein
MTNPPTEQAAQLGDSIASGFAEMVVPRTLRRRHVRNRMADRSTASGEAAPHDIDIKTAVAKIGKEKQRIARDKDELINSVLIELWPRKGADQLTVALDFLFVYDTLSMNLR